MKNLAIAAACVAILAGAGALLSAPDVASAATCRIVGTKTYCQPSTIPVPTVSPKHS